MVGYEDVAVVEGHGVDADENLVGAWGGRWAGGGKNEVAWGGDLPGLVGHCRCFCRFGLAEQIG